MQMICIADMKTADRHREKDFVMRKKHFHAFMIVICLILLAGLAGMLHWIGEANRAQTKRIEQAQQETENYSQEIVRIRTEVQHRETELEAELRQGLEKGMAAIAYQITDASDLTMLQRHIKHYDFMPTVILSAGDDMDRSLLRAIRKLKCDVVLTGTPFDTQTMEKAEKLREEMTLLDVRDTGFFILHSADDTEENRNILAAQGFTGSIRHIDVASCAVEENGLACSGYSMIKTSDFSVRERLDNAVRDRQALVFIFNLQEYANGELNEESILSNLDLIQAEVDKGVLCYASMAEIETALREKKAADDRKKAEFEAFAAEKEQQMLELRMKIDEIYRRWNEVAG